MVVEAPQGSSTTIGGPFDPVPTALTALHEIPQHLTKSDPRTHVGFAWILLTPPASNCDAVPQPPQPLTCVCGYTPRSSSGCECWPAIPSPARTHARTHAHSLKTEISDLKTSITGNEATVFELLGPALKQHRCRADVGCMDPTPRLRSSSRPVNPSPRSVLFFYLYPTPLFLFISYSTAFRVGLRRRRPCDSHHRQAAGNPQRWLRVQVPGS